MGVILLEIGVKRKPFVLAGGGAESLTKLVISSLFQFFKFAILIFCLAGFGWFFIYKFAIKGVCLFPLEQTLPALMILCSVL